MFEFDASPPTLAAHLMAPALNPRCLTAFWLKIRLSEILGVLPERTVAALVCSEATVERHREEFRHDLERHGVPFAASEPAYARLRALYRAEGGLGAATPEGWAAVVDEARQELTARVTSASRATPESGLGLKARRLTAPRRRFRVGRRLG